MRWFSLKEHSNVKEYKSRSGFVLSFLPPSFRVLYWLKDGTLVHAAEDGLRYPSRAVCGKIHSNRAAFPQGVVMIGAPNWGRCPGNQQFIWFAKGHIFPSSSSALGIHSYLSCSRTNALAIVLYIEPVASKDRIHREVGYIVLQSDRSRADEELLAQNTQQDPGIWSSTKQFGYTHVSLCWLYRFEQSSPSNSSTSLSRTQMNNFEKWFHGTKTCLCESHFSILKRQLIHLSPRIFKWKRVIERASDQAQ